MGRVLEPMFGGFLGAVVAFFIVLTLLPPSIDSLEADAAALVLPESDMVSIGSNTGATMIVGWERWSTAEFEDDRSAPAVHGQLAQRVRELGWSVDRATAVQSGLVIDASRALTNARITVGPQVARGERIEASAGRITVSRNEERRAVLFWGSVGLGALAGLWLAQRYMAVVGGPPVSGED